MGQLSLTALGVRTASVLGAIGTTVLGRSLEVAATSLISRSLNQAFAHRPQGPRLMELHLQGSSEGAPIPLVFGRARLAGQVIWAAPFQEVDGRGGGKGGSSQGRYTVSFAVGLCQGLVRRIGRVWANGRPLDLSGFAWRLHRGAEDQLPDPLIAAAEGANAPAYRGLAYVVFEDFSLDEFGATLPQLSFEVQREPAGTGRLEALAQGVCLIPGAGEFTLATEPVRRRRAPGVEASENEHLEAGRADLLVSLDQLQEDLPNCRSVLLVVGWFGSDLRAGQCEIRPKIDNAEKQTTPLSWRVAGLQRGEAAVVSLTDGAPAYGGTPSDETVLAAIAALKARGFAVGLYPFLFMDIPAGNGLPDPQGGAEQAAYPWRGRIRPMAADGSAGVAAEIAEFFGAAGAAQFAPDGAFGGPAEWRFRRFILHYAALARAAGGVDSFILGSELRALTTAWGADGNYPGVAHLQALAQECRALLGAEPVLTYAADWTEYGAHQRADGELRFPLDPLWADPAISAVGIDWYAPLADWRDGPAHADAALSEDGRDLPYLQSRIEGGEAYDWYYPDAQARAAQARLPITDGAYGKPWVYRPKDLRGWWSNPHVERSGGVELGQPTAWVPQAKPIWLVELGCPAVDKGANQPNLFLDAKSAESALPAGSNGAPDDLIQRRALEAYLDFWREGGPNNPTSPVYGGRMLAAAGVHLWCWDARPFPAFPAREELWADGPAWRRGHWLNGRVGAGELAEAVRELCAASGLADVDTSGLRGVVSGYVVDGPASARAALEPLLLVHGVQVSERGGRLVFSQPVAALELDVAELLEAPGLERADASSPVARLDLSFLDPLQDYRIGLVSAVSALPGAHAVEAVELPLALDETQAQVLAERLLAERLEGRIVGSVALPPNTLGVEPGDRVQVAGQSYAVDRIEEGARRSLSLRRSAESLAGPVASAAPAPPRPQLAPEPLALVFAVPPLTPDEANGRPLIAAFAKPWAGPLHVLAGTDETALSTRAEVLRPAMLGRLLWDLYPGPVGRWDEGNVVEIEFLGEAAISVSRAAVLDGANRFALIQPGGAVEVLAAERVELVGEGRWRLSGFLRGLAGTEEAMGAPAPAGSWLVALDERLTRAALSPEEWGAALTWRCRWRRGGADAALAATLPNLWPRPFAPAQLRVWRSAAGDVEMTWVRQARLGGDAWAGEPPLGEEREAYAVEARQNGLLLRAWETNTSQTRYSVAEQQQDGVAEGLLTVSVAQISQAIGAGRRAESHVSV